MTNAANINLNLQKSNNYKVILHGDKQFNSNDVLFYMNEFKIPSISINSADVDTLVNILHFPAQGRMEFEKLRLNLLVDDNLNGFLELFKWMHRLKNPEILTKSFKKGFDPNKPDWKKFNKKDVISNNANQFPIEYRDIDVIITDRNHQEILTFRFIEAWITDLDGLDLTTKNSDYLTVSASFYYDYIEIYDKNMEKIEDSSKIIPIDDSKLRDF